MDTRRNTNDPSVEDQLWGHRWGYRDTSFQLQDNRTALVSGERYSVCGYTMPYLIPFVEEVLRVTFDGTKRPEVALEVPVAKRNEPFVRAVEAAFPGQLLLDDQSRMSFSHGQTTADEVMNVLYNGTLERVADAVFACLRQSDAQALVALAGAHGVCLVPYGGGTSVSCALKLPAVESRMIVVVNMLPLARITHIDRENMLVTVEAGIRGLALERHLNGLGYTIGHEPDSIELSTVGGWIATNASGMKKNRYGNIENLVDNFVLVTPSGTIEMQQTHPRTSHGMQLHKALFGNEGNVGIITQATLRMFKTPAVKRYQAVILRDMESGIAFIKDLRDAGNLPASVRLVDNLQVRFGQALRGKPDFWKTLLHGVRNVILTKVKRFDPAKMVAATIVFEGNKAETRAQEQTLSALARRHHAILGGSNQGRSGYMLTYVIAYIRDFMSDYYILGETYETTVPWDRISDLCRAVQDAAQELHKQYGFPGKSYVSYRITQLYQTGVCIYFTHGLSYRGVQHPEDTFAKMERTIRSVIVERGGSISHHHGIGKLRAGFTDAMYDATTQATIRTIKQHLDPKNIFGIRNNVFAGEARHDVPTVGDARG